MPDDNTKSKGKQKSGAKILPFGIIDGGRSDHDGGDQEAFFRLRSRRKAKASSTNVIVKAMEVGSLSDKTLDALTHSLALEEGKLLYEQEQEELRGFLDLDVIDRRIKTISKMADIILKRRAMLGKQAIDLHSAQFRKILGSLIDVFQSALEKAGINAAKAEDIMVHLADSMEGWEDKMQHELTGEK